MDGEDNVRKEIECTGMKCKDKEVKDIIRSERRKTRRIRKIRTEKKKWRMEECMKVCMVAREKARKKG